MTKAKRLRNGAEIVRRDHLARLAAGAEGLTNLVKTDDAAALKRRELAEQVVAIGRENSRPALAGSKSGSGSTSAVSGEKA
ncbi:hypothetical protein K1W69_25030 [Hoeflea sp. WL0058]|uniref:Uncharacterized protein n=1 Tax=Flavimaribacter sediminis TaxID=2865987 RepID=A0AAE2ZTW4_9HYPH|nr:hypothetical protein [Flavimaribacter sediminis]MBW8640480.1 hypothetical protein [Flavimaribacter sediminis]